jgi:long-chain acyl-CoA synthetase
MNKGKPAALSRDEATFAKLLKRNAESFGRGKAALRVKFLGIWQETSWQEYYQKTGLFSLGLLSLGIEKGDTVAIISSNRPSSLYALIGTEVAGGIPVPLHQDATSAEVCSLLLQFNVKYVIAEDQEQVDKILESGLSPTATLKKVIYCNPRGMGRYRDERLLSLEHLYSLGTRLKEQDPDRFEQLVSRGESDDIAVVCTTSGSSGAARGAMLTHGNIIGMAANLSAGAEMRDGDEFVSFLPLAWFGELMMSVAAALYKGFTVNFPESSDTVMSDLREIGPHIIFAPPQVWERITSTVQVKMMESTPFKRFMYNSFMPIGERVAATRLAGKPASLLSRVLYAVAHVALMRALRDRLGLSRVRAALTGGSALGPDAFRFFHAMGVNLKQVYGLTEISGVAFMHHSGDIKGSTVGLPLPGTEISFSSEGEILLKSAGIFKGYFGDKAADANALKDGWLHTGDAGSLDTDGHLTLIDRLENIIKLADGSLLAPQFVESKLKFSPFIGEALLIGANRPYLAAVVCLNGKIIGKWAGDNKISYSTYSDLVSKPEVYDFIEKELAKTNRELPENARIKRFTLLYKELDADDDEMTRTGKVRRQIVEERYREIIAALYSGAKDLEIDATVDLQEGRSARIQSRVLFRNL